MFNADGQAKGRKVGREFRNQVRREDRKIKILHILNYIIIVLRCRVIHVLSFQWRVHRL